MADIALTYIWALSIVWWFLLIAAFLRANISFMQKWHLPACIIAWLLLLMFGPEVLWKLLPSGTFFSTEIHDAWRTLPWLLINIVFAWLFLWKKIPPVKEIWKIAWPQFSFAQVVAWGQYLIGILLAIFILGPYFGLPEMVWWLIEVAFEWWHWTVAWLSSAFEQLWFSEWYDIWLWLATIWVFAWILGWVILVNWWIATGRTSFVRNKSFMSLYELKWLFDPARAKKAIWLATTRPEAIEPITVHIAFIWLSVVLWYLIHTWLWIVEWLLVAEQFQMVRYIPIFPLAMIWWVIIQLVVNKYVSYPIIDRETILRICWSAMDILIVAALANLSLQVIGTYFVPFILLAFFWIAWNVFCFMFLASKMMRDYWFEKWISDYGQATWMTAIWLLLVKMSDPENRWPALTSFGYKQLLFEPFLWWWLLTATSIPLIATFGAQKFWIVSGILMVWFFVFWYFVFGRWKKIQEVSSV